jgi:methylamine dehydrogenase accessory protein MauD
MMFLVSQGLLWIAVLVLAIVVLALARQVGVLHERIAPVGALAIARGPQAGEAAPKISARTLAGTVLDIGSPLPPGKLQLLFFVSPTCPVCKSLLPTAKLFAHSESLDLVLVGDGDLEAHRRMAARYDLPLDRFVNSAVVGRAFQVGKLPYAVLISELGIIVAQGLVNTREHLESLIVAHETGLRSVQEYLNSGRSAHVPVGVAKESGQQTSAT